MELHSIGFCAGKICCPWASVEITTPTTPPPSELRSISFCARKNAGFTNPTGWNCTPSAFALERFFFCPRANVGIALRRMRRLQAPPAWNCTWKIFVALAGITSPTCMELHLEDFFALGRNYKPRRGGIALGRFFALGRESKTLPGWNCTWKIFRPCARIKYPAGVELHLEDFSPLGEDYKTHPGGNWTWKIFRPWGRITNSTRMELHFRGIFAQTPPGWNCIWKIFRPWMRIANATVVELHLEDFFALAQESRTPPRMELHFGRYLAHKPHPEGIVVWKISRSQTPPGRNCTLEDLSLTNPTRMELHFGRSFALG